jgi:hypothetical protein
MSKSIIFLLIVFILNARSLLGQMDAKVLRHQEADGLVSYTLVIPPDKFTDRFLLKLSNEYLTRFHQANLLNVRIFIDSATASECAGAGVTEITSDNWNYEYEKRRQIKSLYAAELLKFGDTASLRIRYADRHIQEIPIKGQNAFHFTVDGINLDVLYVAFVLQGIPLRKLFPIVFCRSSRDITKQEAEKLAKSTFLTSGAIRMKIDMRTDEWFGLDYSYPWFNPFGAGGPSPTPAQEARSAEYRCTLPGEAACYQSRSGTE